jgi:hypothetical protein
MNCSMVSILKGRDKVLAYFPILLSIMKATFPKDGKKALENWFSRMEITIKANLRATIFMERVSTLGQTNRNTMDSSPKASNMVSASTTSAMVTSTKDSTKTTSAMAKASTDGKMARPTRVAS